MNKSSPDQTMFFVAAIAWLQHYFWQSAVTLWIGRMFTAIFLAIIFLGFLNAIVSVKNRQKDNPNLNPNSEVYKNQKCK